MLVPVAAIGCDDDDGSADAGEDAGRDAGRRFDAGSLMCEPECSGTDSCCPGDPDDVCVNLLDDVRHCGICGNDCLATHGGDACTRGVCSCGGNELGCRGTTDSFCCTEVEGTPVPPYCANLEQDITDCGQCGFACTDGTGNRCDGGECRCGFLREPCDGTPTSTCCVNGADVGCADLTTDQFNCGRCDNLCQGIERCDSGVCTRGPQSCSAGCGTDEICCGGACCTRADCMAGTCGTLVDGGMPDAGAPDAGPGMSDAGPADAGPGDAG